MHIDLLTLGLSKADNFLRFAQLSFFLADILPWNYNDLIVVSLALILSLFPSIAKILKTHRSIPIGVKVLGSSVYERLDA